MFTNYESYFLHLNALLKDIAINENSDSKKISDTKKLVIDILKSPVEENKIDGVKIINKVFGEISYEDVSDLSIMLSSIVKTFVYDFDVQSLGKIEFSVLETGVLQELLKKRFKDIPADPYSKLILDFNSLGQKKDIPADPYSKLILDFDSLGQKQEKQQKTSYISLTIINCLLDHVQ